MRERFLKSDSHAIKLKGETMNNLKRLAAVLMVPLMLMMVPYSAMGKTKKDDKNKKAAEDVKAEPASEKSPLAVNVGGAVVKVGGFLDGMFVFRDTNTGGNLVTPFGTTPYNNTVQGNISETRLSAQNSQFTLSVKDQFDDNTVKAFMETDFLGNAAANLFVTSNSNTLRMRQYWVDITKGQVEFTIGQAYSLLTPNRFGLSPENGDVYGTRNLDPNKQVGLSWTRAMQFRVAVHPIEGFTLGLALENPEQYVGVGEVIFPFQYNAALGIQFDAGNNTATPNGMPDVIAKMAYDFDNTHVEAGAYYRSFAVDVVPPGYTYGAPFPGIPRMTADCVGGEFNVLLGLSKEFHLVATSFAGNGAGRYLGGLGPDLVMKVDNAPVPNLSISPVFAFGGTTGFEFQVTPDTFFAGYFGFDNFERNSFLDTTSPLVNKPTIGFGGINSPNSANRYIRQFSVDLIQNIWKSQGHGALQWGAQYSFVDREPGFVATGAPMEAPMNMLYTDIKYILP
jgi:hypothetical protein